MLKEIGHHPVLEMRGRISVTLTNKWVRGEFLETKFEGVNPIYAFRENFFRVEGKDK